MVGRTLLHYTILSELGEGAMGRVFLARDTRTDRRVALKLLSADMVRDPEWRARMAREAQVAARLSHPGIVALHALEDTGDEQFLVEEFIEGESLAKVLERGPLGVAETLRLARELAAALAHAHHHGVLHRDLKPDNVLVAADGSYKVADFGIARLEGSTTLTEPGALVGTLPYMAPERIRGHRGDARSDLFSLGAILYEALAGRRAFPGGQAEVIHGVLNEDPPTLGGSGTRGALAGLIPRLLAKEPRERPASAEAVLGAIDGIGAARTVPSRRGWVPAVAVVVVIAVLGVAWFFYHPASTPADAPAIAVLYFENVADPSDPNRLGSITGNLLVTSLAQSPEINVLGTERVLDALRQIGRQRRPVDRSLALEVARRAGAGRIVAGSILQTSPLVLTAELVEVRTGKVLDAYRIEGEPGQTVFQVVDALGRKLTSRLASATEAIRLAPVAQRTSADLEAVRLYLSGLEHLSHGELDLATQAFTAALRRDPDFAQAQYQVAIARWWAGEPEDAESAIRGAELHQDRLSPAERNALRGVKALVDRDWKEAATVFGSIAEQDPGDKLSLYGLVEARYHGHDLEGAVRAGRQLLAEDSSFTLASIHVVDAASDLGWFALADSVARAGLLVSPHNSLLWVSYLRGLSAQADAKAAFAAFDRAVAAGVLNPTLLGACATIALARDSLPRAERYIRLVEALPLPPLMRDEVQRAKRYTFALRAGHFREAVAIANQSWRAWKRPPIPTQFAIGGPALPIADGIEAALGARDVVRARAFAESVQVRIERWRGGVTRHPVIGVRGQIYQRLGLVEESKRELARLEALPQFKRDPHQAWYVRGLILGGEGRFDEGLAWLAAGEPPTQPSLRIGTRRLDRMLLLQAAHRPAEALALLDTLTSFPLIGIADAIRLSFYRGRLLEDLGRPDDARDSYARFLDHWPDADPGTPEVAEARAALERLGRTHPTAARPTR